MDVMADPFVEGNQLSASGAHILLLVCMSLLCQIWNINILERLQEVYIRFQHVNAIWILILVLLRYVKEILDLLRWMLRSNQSASQPTSQLVSKF